MGSSGVKQSARSGVDRKEAMTLADLNQALGQDLAATFLPVRTPPGAAVGFGAGLVADAHVVGEDARMPGRRSGGGGGAGTGPASGSALLPPPSPRPFDVARMVSCACPLPALKWLEVRSTLADVQVVSAAARRRRRATGGENGGRGGGGGGGSTSSWRELAGRAVRHASPRDIEQRSVTRRSPRPDLYSFTPTFLLTLADTGSGQYPDQSACPWPRATGSHPLPHPDPDVGL